MVEEELKDPASIVRRRKKTKNEEEQETVWKIAQTNNENKAQHKAKTDYYTKYKIKSNEIDQ